MTQIEGSSPGPVPEDDTQSKSSVPDYLLDPDAILKDKATWRNGQAPDYSTTRKVYQETKRCSHAPGSLESMVENLVKNWEIEASHKMQVSDWRTVDPENYTFSINGGPPQDAEHMLKVGTYNAIIAPSQYYDPAHSDFEKSHKTFRDMMPNFAWEVLEVYSPPPVVAFRWRHWGVMKSDYIGWNNNGEKITIKGHGGALDIQGLTVAKLNDKLQVTALETWFDPVGMFNQMKPNTKHKEVIVGGQKLDKSEADDLLENSTDTGVRELAQQFNGDAQSNHLLDTVDGVANANSDHVHLQNPSAPGVGGREVSEVRQANGDTVKRARLNGEQSNDVSSCPFLNGGSRE